MLHVWVLGPSRLAKWQSLERAPKLWKLTLRSLVPPPARTKTFQLSVSEGTSGRVPQASNLQHKLLCKMRILEAGDESMNNKNGNSHEMKGPET